MSWKLTRKQVEQIVESAHEEGQRPDLNIANLVGVDLSGANLRETDLIGQKIG